MAHSVASRRHCTNFLRWQRRSSRRSVLRSAAILAAGSFAQHVLQHQAEGQVGCEYNVPAAAMPAAIAQQTAQASRHHRARGRVATTLDSYCPHISCADHGKAGLFIKSGAAVDGAACRPQPAKSAKAVGGDLLRAAHSVTLRLRDDPADEIDRESLRSI